MGELIPFVRFAADEDGICEYVDIRDDEELMEGVRQMEGLGASIYNSGRSEGLLEGQLRMLAEFVLEGMISMTDAARRMNMSEIDFMSAVESIFGASKGLK